MFEVTVEDTFAAGHYLRNYKGKCENPHGHNYKIRVTLAGAELDKAGLLLDFKDLREVMKHVIERLDHQMINEIEPFTVINPSAENLAKYFYEQSNTQAEERDQRPRASEGRNRLRDRHHHGEVQRISSRQTASAGRTPARRPPDCLPCRSPKSTNRCKASRLMRGCRACSCGLTGCNLRCSWCDSEYTFQGGRKMAVEEVLRRGLAPESEWRDWSRSPAASRCCRSGRWFR